MVDTGRLKKRQDVLADLSGIALQSDDLEAVLTQACGRIASAFGTARARVMAVEAGSGRMDVAGDDRRVEVPIVLPGGRPRGHPALRSRPAARALRRGLVLLRRVR